MQEGGPAGGDKKMGKYKIGNGVSIGSNLILPVKILKMQ